MVSQLADILFVCDQGPGRRSPRLPVTWTRELMRRRTARQVEPGGDGGVVEGGVSLIFTRWSEDGNWSLFLGGDFIQCDDIPLMMAGGKNQSRK